MPLGIYEKILAVDETEEMTAEDRTIQIVGIINGLTDAEVDAMLIPDFRELAAAAAFLTTDIPTHRARDRYVLGGRAFTVTPEVNKMQTQQYIDYQTVTKDVAKRSEMMAVLLVPEGKKYTDDYDFEEVRQIIADHLTVAEAKAIDAFFMRRSVRSMRSTLTFSEGSLKTLKARTAARLTKMHLTAFLQNGVGLVLSIRWRRLVA